MSDPVFADTETVGYAMLRSPAQTDAWIRRCGGDRAPLALRVLAWGQGELIAAGRWKPGPDGIEALGELLSSPGSWGRFTGVAAGDQSILDACAREPGPGPLAIAAAAPAEIDPAALEAALGRLAALAHRDEDKGGKPRLALRTHADRLRDRLRPREAIIPKFVYRGELAALVSPPKRKKTFAAIAAAEGAAAGMEFAGRPCAKGRVLFIAADSPGSVERRLLALSEAAAERVVTVVEWRGDKEGMALLEDALTEAKETGDPFDVLIVDTFDSVRPAGGGRSWIDVDDACEEIMGAFRRIAQRHRIGILVVHHGTKADGSNPRGSLVFLAKLDALHAVEAGEGDQIILRTVLARDDEEGEIGRAVIDSVQIPGGPTVGKLRWLTAVESAAAPVLTGESEPSLDDEALRLVRSIAKRGGRSTSRELRSSEWKSGRGLEQATDRARVKGFLVPGRYELTAAGQAAAASSEDLFGASPDTGDRPPENQQNGGREEKACRPQSQKRGREEKACRPQRRHPAGRKTGGREEKTDGDAETESGDAPQPSPSPPLPVLVERKSGDADGGLRSDDEVAGDRGVA